MTTPDASRSTADRPPGIADVTFTERAAYLADPDALVVADLHIGRDAGTNLELPLGERAALVDGLAALLDRFEPSHVVVAGDLLDAFGSLPSPVEGTIRSLADAVAEHDAALTVATGNHDTMIDVVFAGERVPEIRLDDGTVVCHGAADPGSDAERTVIGHDHPTLAVGGRKYPCALVGPIADRRGTLIILPAFSPLPRGTTINRLTAADLQTPLVDDLDAFHPVVTTDGDTRWFPPLGEFRNQL